MKIAVGSRNPVKIAATRNVMLKIYSRAEIISVGVDSKVSHNPLNDEEAIDGAKERAKEAYSSINADLGVGLEGATTTIAGKQMTAGWAAVFDGKNFYLGGGGHLLLPPAVDRKIVHERKELGTAMDELTGGENTKQKAGAIGILTKGLSNRQKAYESILIYALSPLISPHLYKSDEEQ